MHYAEVDSRAGQIRTSPDVPETLKSDGMDPGLTPNQVEGMVRDGIRSELRMDKVARHSRVGFLNHPTESWILLEVCDALDGGKREKGKAASPFRNETH